MRVRTDHKRAYDRAYHEANRERIAARKREWWQANKVEQTARQKANKSKRRGWRYGITPTELAELTERQGGRCAVCGRSGSLHIDHDHASGAVRGLLCLQCNMALGMVGDDPELLRRLIEYLASPPFAVASSTGQRAP